MSGDGTQVSMLMKRSYSFSGSSGSGFSGAQPQGTAFNNEIVPESWHPRLQLLYEYWLSIKPAKGLPGRQHLNPVDFRTVLPATWLLDVQHEPFRLRYRLVGTKVVEALGRDVTGQWMDDAHPHVKNDPRFFARFHQVASSGQPSWRRGRPLFWYDRPFSLIENLALPLASDGRTVDILMINTVFHKADGSEF